MEEKMWQDTLEAAKKIQEHQGNHEVEVSYGGEADLHRHYRRCKKNPGHIQFVPVQDFKIEHLPPGYRDNDIVDWIRAEADMTCRLSVRYISENRPKFNLTRQPLSYYPFYQDRGCDLLRTGTGRVGEVQVYTEEDNKICECNECNRPGTHTPKKVWGKVTIRTACHVVYDSDEARHTTCEFFYDTSITHVSQCLTLTGLKVECSNIKRDSCKMTCATHDMDVIDKLYKIYQHRKDLWGKMWYKYEPNKNNDLKIPSVTCVTEPTPQPVVIISHPHGCSKMVTVGMWTYRQTCGEAYKYRADDDWEAERIGTCYRYNTATCPGSSGAPVIRLLEKRKWRWASYHSHSEGGKGNDNKSGIWAEIV